MLRPYKVQNIKRGYLLEARIMRGRELLQQAAITYGRQAAGGVPRDARLQVRETNLKTGEKTPWQTSIRALPAEKRKKKNPKKQKPGELVKRHLKKVKYANKLLKTKGPAAAARYYEKNAKLEDKAGRPIRAAEYRLEAKRLRAMKKPAKKSASKKRNPRKRERPPAEWFYYRAALVAKQRPGIKDPEAVAGNIWYNTMKPATRTKINRLKNEERAAGRNTVVTTRQKLTRTEVTKELGKAEAARVYRNIKISPAERKAARKALGRTKKKKNPRRKPRGQKAIRRLRTCKICGKKVMDVLGHYWKEHREKMLRGVKKGQKARRKKEKAQKRRKANKCMKTTAI